MRHSVHWIGRFSFRASRQQATSCGCDVILLPKPPPMSCVTMRSLSVPTRMAGAIMITANPGNWLFVVHRPLPGAAVVLDEGAAELERRRVEAVEVQLGDRDDVVCLGERGVDVAPLPDARVGHVPAALLVEHGRAVLERLAGVDDDVERLVLDLDELRGVARELARLGDDGRDRLADVAHLADGERVVLDLPAGVGCDLEERVGEDRDLVARQRPVDARERERGADVDRARSARARRASARSGGSPSRAA